MYFSFGTVAALVLLFKAASCAPSGLNLQNACAHVKSSSLELNHVAKIVSIKARNGSKDVTDFSTSLVWIEAKDMCDPETLKHEPATCMGKILDALTKYKSAVERVSRFQSCSEFVHRVNPAIRNLHKDISACGKLRGDNLHEKLNIIEETQPLARWQESLLCQYTLDRLFSFSILTARVFAVGDPARHTDVFPQKCM